MSSYWFWGGGMGVRETLRRALYGTNAGNGID